MFYPRLVYPRRGMIPRPMSLQRGTVIGMGVVYRARDGFIGRRS